MAQIVKNLPAKWETWVRFLGREDPLERGMATHSSILAWRIPWTEEPGGPWGHKESDTTEQLGDISVCVSALLSQCDHPCLLPLCQQVCSLLGDQCCVCVCY